MMTACAAAYWATCDKVALKQLSNLIHKIKEFISSVQDDVTYKVG